MARLSRVVIFVDVVPQNFVVYYVTTLEVIKVLKLVYCFYGGFSFSRRIIVIKVLVLRRVSLHNLLFVCLILLSLWLLHLLWFFFIFKYAATAKNLLAVLECFWIASAPAYPHIRWQHRQVLTRLDKEQLANHVNSQKHHVQRTYDEPLEVMKADSNAC